MGRGYLRHIGQRRKGSTWCKLCYEGRDCKFANYNNEEKRRKPLTQPGYGKKPKVIKIEQ